ncbi:MAG TPA: AzlD domain-containing protein [Candidimonas sp.]|nr:AzlD domain-containing protein [Candidimonas sp.]
MIAAEPFDWYIFGAIALLTLCSLLTRAGYFLFGDHFPLTDSVRSALRYAPTAALIGIVTPELLPWHEGVGYVFDIKVVAAAIAVLIYMRTRSSLLVIVAGMAAFWILRAALHAPSLGIAAG